MQNKDNMKRTVLIILCVFCTLGIFAQDWDTDIAKAAGIFKNDAFEIEVEHQLFPSLTAIDPMERQTVRLCRQGDKFYLDQYGMRVICDGRYTVFVHPEARMVGIELLQKPDDTAQAPSEGWQMVLQAIEQLGMTQEAQAGAQKKDYTCTYVGKKENSKVYRFDYDYGEYQQTTVYFSAATGLLERSSTIVRQPMEVEPGIFRQVRIDFVYKKQQSGKAIDKRYFSFADIVTVSAQGDVKLQEKYKTYQLLNHLK